MTFPLMRRPSFRGDLECSPDELDEDEASARDERRFDPAIVMDTAECLAALVVDVIG